MTKYVRKYQAREDNQTPAVPARPHGSCCAPGCLLPGTWSNSIVGGDSWVCFVHDRARGNQWASATAHMRNRAGIVDMFLDAMKLSALRPWQWAKATTEDRTGKVLVEPKNLAYGRWCNEVGRDDLIPAVDERLDSWIFRLRKTIIAECVP